jgi:predicted transcriptional regulator
MNEVRRILDLDPETDARIKDLALARGQHASAVVADAIALLDAVVDVRDLDVEEDLRRFREFERTGEAVRLEDVKAWVRSWGTGNELPRPVPRKVG